MHCYEKVTVIFQPPASASLALESYLALAGEADWGGQCVLAYAEREFRRYAQCGMPLSGFVGARCPSGGHDLLVAVSRQGRRLCPSCSARPMAETTTLLVDHVFPQSTARRPATRARPVWVE